MRPRSTSIVAVLVGFWLLADGSATTTAGDRPVIGGDDPEPGFIE